MDTQTKTREKVNRLTAPKMMLRQVDAVIENLVNKRKDVERQLVDIRAQISVYEDEIKNAITTGRRFLEGIQNDAAPGLEEMDEFLDGLNSTSKEMGSYVDAIARRRAMLEKNHKFADMLEEVRKSFTESIDNLETLKSMLLNESGSFSSQEIQASKGSGKQASLGSSAIIRSQETERQRIAREIHDGPAQAIANVVLRLDIVKKVYDQNTDAVPEELSKMKELAQGALNEIRGFIFDLRPMTLQDLGLAATIKRVINTMSGVDKCEVQFIHEGEERELDQDVKLAIFRITQECLNNMRKHSKAKFCWVHLKYLPNKVILIVEDDGIGFDEGTVEDSQRKYISFGMLGMRERADDIGASLEMKSEPGAGTKVTLVVINR